MINPDNVYHVLPTNDLKDHVDKVTYPLIGMPYCDCPCKPELREEKDCDGLLVIHNSFDGREHFEYPNKVREN